MQASMVHVYQGCILPNVKMFRYSDSTGLMLTGANGVSVTMVVVYASTFEVAFHDARLLKKSNKKEVPVALRQFLVDSRNFLISTS